MSTGAWPRVEDRWGSWKQVAVFRRYMYHMQQTIDIKYIQYRIWWPRPEGGHWGVWWLAGGSEWLLPHMYSAAAIKY
jgi:hypothetical protein